jgi:hypothetical protein
MLAIFIILFDGRQHKVLPEKMVSPSREARGTSSRV